MPPEPGSEVFARPANAFVMRFLGHVNVLDAELAGGRARVGDITLDVGHHNGDSRGRVYIRPHDIALARAPADGALAARVVRVTPRVIAHNVNASEIAAWP